jgi:peptidoglycan-associated lipoprotein
MRTTAYLITTAGVVLAAACSSTPKPAPPAPQPTAAEIAMHRHVQDSLDAVARVTADSLEQARLMAIAAKARADSVEQARLAAETLVRQAAEQNASLRDELAVIVHFDVAKSALTPEGREALDRKAAILTANPDVRIKITGGCDDRGSDQYNQALGQRRAAAAKAYLVGKGIDIARLEGVSTGEKSPVDSGTGEAAWALNRRAEFSIVSGDMPLAMNN